MSICQYFFILTLFWSWGKDKTISIGLDINCAIFFYIPRNIFFRNFKLYVSLGCGDVGIYPRTDNLKILKIWNVWYWFVTFFICLTIFHLNYMRAIDSSRREFLFLPLVVQNGQVFVILQEFESPRHQMQILPRCCHQMQILSRNAESAKKH